MALSFSTDRHSSVIWSWEALVKDIPLAEPPLVLVKTFLTGVVATAGLTRKIPRPSPDDDQQLQMHFLHRLLDSYIGLCSEE